MVLRVSTRPFFTRCTIAAQIASWRLAACRGSQLLRSVCSPVDRPTYWSARATGLWLRPSECCSGGWGSTSSQRSEEHTSELQSRENLVCRLLLEKKNDQIPC